MKGIKIQSSRPDPGAVPDSASRAGSQHLWLCLGHSVKPFHELAALIPQPKPLARLWCPSVLPGAGVQWPQSLQMCWRNHLHHPYLCHCSKFSLFKDSLAALRCPHCSKAAEHLEEHLNTSHSP